MRYITAMLGLLAFAAYLPGCSDHDRDRDDRRVIIRHDRDDRFDDRRGRDHDRWDSDDHRDDHRNNDDHHD